MLSSGNARDAAQAADELQVLAPGKVRVQMRLLGDVADAPLKAREVVVNGLAVVKDLAVGGLDQARQHLDGRALARAVRPQVAEDLPRADPES